MFEETPPLDLKNAAWVTIPTRLPAAELFSACHNVERLFRLNPYLRIFSWRALSKNRFEAEWENYSNEQTIKIATGIEVAQLDNELQLKYAAGIKRKTYFRIEQPQSTNGSLLMIIDDYGDSSQSDIQQVDKSLSAWGQAAEKFFARYYYLRHIPCADKLIDRFWIRLSPSGRRIAYILIVITAIELIALLLFVVLYWLL